MLLREVKLLVSAGTTQTTETDDEIDLLCNQIEHLVDQLASTLRGDGYDVVVAE